MSACEKCWGEAYGRSRDSGRSQTECYQEILKEREDNPCSKAEQVFGRNCNMFNKDNIAEEINRAIDRYVKPLEEKIKSLENKE